MDCGPQYTCISDVDSLVIRDRPIGESQPIYSVNDHPLPLHEDTGTFALSVVGLWSDSEGERTLLKGNHAPDRVRCPFLCPAAGYGKTE